MGLITINLGKSASQASKRKRGNLYGETKKNYTFTFSYAEQFLHAYFLTKREIWVMKLEGSFCGHVWICTFMGKVAAILWMNSVWKFPGEESVLLLHVFTWKLYNSQGPNDRFHILHILEVLEESEKAWGTVSSEGGSHPLGCVGCGEETWWIGINCGKLITERGILANLRDHHLLWIHIPNLRVTWCWELEQQVYSCQNVRPLQWVAYFLR